jgi:tetratricopeptide (TPR) repeat protein
MISLLQEAVSLVSEDDPEHMDYIQALSFALSMHCLRSHPLNQQYLDEAIQFATSVIDSWPSGKEKRHLALLVLATALTADNNEGTLDDERLARAIECDMRALEECPVGSADHPHISAHYGDLLREFGIRDVLAASDEVSDMVDLAHRLGSLDMHGPLQASSAQHKQHRMAEIETACRLLKIYVVNGDVDSLQESISVHRNCLALMNICDPLHAVTVASLMSALVFAYTHSDDPALLNEASGLLEAVLSTCPENHPDRPFVVVHAIHVLVARYHLTGDDIHVDRAISLSREAKKQVSPSNVIRTEVFTNLAHVLNLRYRRTGDALANEEAISLLRELLDAVPESLTKQILVWENLAVALQYRADHLHDMESIDESIRLHRLVVKHLPEDHSHAPKAWSNLSRALERKWFAQATVTKESFALIAEALNCEKEAMRLITPQHQHWPTAELNAATILMNMQKSASALEASFSSSQQMYSMFYVPHEEELFVAVITSCHDALEFATPGHWDRTRAHMILAEVHVVQNSNHYDVSSAIDHMLQALQSSVSELPLLLHALIDFLPKVDIPDLAIDSEIHLLDLYARTVEFLPLVVDFALDGRAQLKNIKVASNLGTAAFASALRAGKPEQGLEILELACGMIWSQALHLRDPQVGDVPPEHAAQLRSLLQSLSQCSVSASPGNIGSNVDERHQNSGSIRKLLHEIRSKPGLEKFMLGTPAQSLLEASSSHPVVLLVPVSGRINALIIRSPTEPMIHLVLGQTGVIDSGRLVGDVRQARAEDNVAREDHDDDDGAAVSEEARGMKIKQKVTISRVTKLLGQLWIDTVKPILVALDMQVSSSII